MSACTGYLIACTVHDRAVAQRGEAARGVRHRALRPYGPDLGMIAHASSTINHQRRRCDAEAIADARAFVGPHPSPLLWCFCCMYTVWCVCTDALMYVARAGLSHKSVLPRVVCAYACHV